MNDIPEKITKLAEVIKQNGARDARRRLRAQGLFAKAFGQIKGL